MSFDFVVLFCNSLIQGVTEFIPVSSSLHLSLWGYFFPLQTHIRGFHVLLHLGTLGAVISYFFSDLLRMARSTLTFDTMSKDFHTAWVLILATLPTVIIGYFVHTYAYCIPSFKFMGCVSIVCGALLLSVDKIQPQKQLSLAWTQALLLGLFQSVAFIPGASRLGMTLTGARFFGLERIEAVRLSFLLSIPSVLGAVVLESFNNIPLLAYGTVFLTGIMGYAVIGLMMRYLQKGSFIPFMVYRISLGIFLLFLE